MSGDSAPSREAGKGIAGGSGAGAAVGSGSAVTPFDWKQIGHPATTHTLLGKSNCSHAADKETYVVHPLRGEGFDASEDGTGRGTPLVPVGFNARQDPDHWHDRTGPLDTDGSTQAVAFAENSRAEVRLEGGDGSRCGAISTGGGKPGQGVPMIAHTMQVRRLTPRECARLQGFPDDYLDITYRNKPAADGPKYKALGNSWAVPVVRWIGERIQGAA